MEEFGADGVETFGQVDFLQAAVVVVAEDALGKISAAVGHDDGVETVAGGEGIATDGGDTVAEADGPYMAVGEGTFANTAPGIGADMFSICDGCCSTAVLPKSVVECVVAYYSDSGRDDHCAQLAATLKGVIAYGVEAFGKGDCGECIGAGKGKSSDGSH